MTPKLLSRAIPFTLITIAIILLGATTTLADCPDPVKPSVAGPLQMLVLGDSIMWGQGLREEEKASSRVKCWLQEKTGREVNIHVEAHSGAVVSGGAAEPIFTTTSGEVNLTTPTINQQLDNAIQFYKNGQTRPSLILMNGCINDVGVKTLLAASTTLDDLSVVTRKKCGEDMQSLLSRVTNSFPESHVFVMSYYPIVSKLTDDNAFLRLLVKKLNNQRPDARRMSDKEMRERLIALSAEWYKTSTASLKDAVSRTNASGSPAAKVHFVEIQFGPEHVFAAPDTVLWNFVFASTNVSGFTKVIVWLSFGTAAYKPNDHVREIRVKSCEQTFQKPKGTKESKEVKNARNDLFLICRYASLGHPNQWGALIYSEAIKGQLLSLVDGWKN